MKRRWRQRFSTATLLVTVLLGVRTGAAEPVTSKVVLLEAVGNPVDVDALRTSLEDWLRSMQLELHLVSTLPPFDAEAAFARVRVVWTDDACVVEVFGATGALRRRKSLPRGGPPLLVSESAALIAQAGVQELSIEESRSHPLPAPVAEVSQVHEAPPPPAPGSAFALDVGAYVQGRSYNETSPFLFGGGAEVAASFGAGPWHPGVSLLLAYQGPVSEEVSLLTLQLQVISVRLLPTVRRQLGPFEVELGLGGGLDALIASTTTTVPREFVRHRRLDAAPFFTLEAGLRWKVTPASAIFLRAVLDLDPARRRYLANVAGETQYLLEPWVARPALQLGFTFDVVSR